jgi:hypothetical protein
MAAAGGVDAPGAAAGDGEIQEDEAIEDGRVATVEYGEKTARGVRHEIGEGHFTRQDEGHRPGEQADQHQQAAEQFQHARQPRQREQFRAGIGRGREAQQFLGAVLHEQQGGDDAQDGEHSRRPDGGNPGGGHRTLRKPSHRLLIKSRQS